MPFDMSTARSMKPKFDLSSAKPIVNREELVSNLAQSTSEAERLNERARNMKFMPEYNLFADEQKTPATIGGNIARTGSLGLRSALGAQIPGQELTMRKPSLAGAVAGGALGGIVPAVAGVGAETLTRHTLPNLLPQSMGESKRENITNVASMSAGLLAGAGAFGLQNLGKAAVGKISSARTILKEAPDEISKFADDITNLEAGKSVEISALKDKALQLKDAMKEKTRTLLSKGKEQMQETAGRAAEDFQGELVRLFKTASTRYGEKFDKIVSSISKKAKGVLPENAYNAVVRASQKIQDALMDVPAPIQKLLEKYSRDTVRDASGRIISAPKNINLAEVVSDIKSLRNMMSGAMKSGQRMLSDDLPLEYAIDELTNVINEATGGAFSSLQRAYSPIMQMKTKASSIFKPYGGIYQTTPGARFLTRLASGSAPKAEKELYRGLTSGKSEFYSSAKDVTSDISSVKNALDKSMRWASQRMKTINNAERSSIEKIANKFSDDIANKKLSVKELQTLFNDAQKLDTWIKRAGVGVGAIAVSRIPFVRRILHSIIGNFI